MKYYEPQDEWKTTYGRMNQWYEIYAGTAYQDPVLNQRYLNNRSQNNSGSSHITPQASKDMKERFTAEEPLPPIQKHPKPKTKSPVHLDRDPSLLTSNEAIITNLATDNLKDHRNGLGTPVTQDDVTNEAAKPNHEDVVSLVNQDKAGMNLAESKQKKKLNAFGVLPPIPHQVEHKRLDRSSELESFDAGAEFQKYKPWTTLTEDLVCHGYPSYLQFSKPQRYGERINAYGPSLPLVRLRQGRGGGSWKHVGEATQAGGDRTMFINGLPRIAMTNSEFTYSNQNMALPLSRQVNECWTTNKEK